MSLCPGRLRCSVSSNDSAPVGTKRASQSLSPRSHRSTNFFEKLPKLLPKLLATDASPLWPCSIASHALRNSGSVIGSSRCSNPNTALSSARLRAKTLVCIVQLWLGSSVGSTLSCGKLSKTSRATTKHESYFAAPHPLASVASLRSTEYVALPPASYRLPVRGLALFGVCPAVCVCSVTTLTSAPSRFLTVSL